MKSTNKIDGDVLIRGIAQNIMSKDKHVVIAQEAIDLKDEAKQSAQSYWMMGWTWDEIESVLEDSEYPKNVINYAMKEAKEYAKKILNEGPFSVLKVGQKVKLANGEVGILEEKYANHIVISSDNLDNIAISADQLDIIATEKLREAHALRLKATNMLYKLSTDQLSPIFIDSQEVDPSLKIIDDALAVMASIKQNSDEVKREAAKIHGKWEKDVGKWVPKSKEEEQFAQYVQVTLTGENQIDNEITELFHNKLGNILKELHDTVAVSAAITPEAINTFLNNTFTDIADKLEAHLYGIKQRNAKAREYVQQFAKFGTEKADWQQDALNFSISSWDLTKEFIETWENILVPQIENGIQLISTFLMDNNKQQIAASIQKALKIS